MLKKEYYSRGIMTEAVKKESKMQMQRKEISGGRRLLEDKYYRYL